MITKKIIKITVPLFISVILGNKLYHYLFAFTSKIQIHPHIKNTFESGIQFGPYFMCLTLVFSLISLPFILSVFANELNIKNYNLLKTILIVEISIILLLFVTTPPDIVTRIFGFIIWQIPILANLLALLFLRKGG